MSPPVQFLHMADLHIGLRITRFEEDIHKKLLEARFQALDNALKIARERDVDFILICGDLFDDNAVSLVDAQRVFDMLKGKTTPVYILPGNHDPFCAGSVWQRSPWNGTQDTSIHVLHECKPVVAGSGITLYPCPVTQKTSNFDPTAWVLEDNNHRDMVRIGLAHGSVMDRDTLPDDDHPIPTNAPNVRGLDYLALGHWHTQKLYLDATGARRMAYPGTHEQMGFDESSGFSMGWAAYARNPERSEFLGAARGSALFVKIQSPRAVPIIEPVDVGQFVWTSETIEVTDEADFRATFSSIAQRPNPERSLISMKLKGILSAEGIIQLDAFREMLNRYLYCNLDTNDLHLKPSDDALQTIVGHGVLCRVLERIRANLEHDISEDERMKHERALIALYRLAKEVE